MPSLRERKGMILLLTELESFARDVRKEVNAGRVYVSASDGSETLAVGVREQNKTIDLMLKGYSQIETQLHKIIVAISTKDEGANP